MRAIRWVVVGCGLFAMFGSACGGKNSSTRPGVDTGLPPEKKLGDLTDAEVQQACERFAQAYTAEFTPAKVTSFVCTALSLSTAQTPATCQTETSQCIANPPSGITTDVTAPDCSGSSASGLAGCGATVSEMETCLSDELAALQAFMAKYNCSVAGNAQAIQNLASAEFTQPQSCTAIETKCPGSTTTTDPTSGSAGAGGTSG